MHTTIRGINIFVRVVEAKSFAAAARSLLIDPAAVSRAIKGLEEDLGVLLFRRSTRTLNLTAEGTRFYRDCVQILKKVDDATQRFRANDGTAHGQLSVGMGPTLTRRMLLQALPPFQQQHPHIKIVLLSVNEIAEMEDGSIDVLIRTRSLRQRGGQHKESQGVVVRKLIQSRPVVCASPEYLDRAGFPDTPADLLRHSCVARVTLERDVQDEWQFVKSHVRHKVKFVPKLLVHGDALREAGLAGCGIIRLLACHVEDELRLGRLVPVLSDWECTGGPPIVAIYRKTKPTLPQVSAFVRYLTETFRRYNVETERH